MRLEVSGLALRAAAVVGLAVSLAGCGLDKKEIPALVGPAELGLSFQLDARPDVVTADGFSTVSLQATVRNQLGQPAPGVAMFFAIANGEGVQADIGTLNTNTAVTNSVGVAQVIYTTPARTDATTNRWVEVQARPIGGDASGVIYRTVRVELRSAEPRLFPQDPRNCNVSTPTPGQGGCPFCSFVVEGPFGKQFLFQSTSFDSPDATGRVGYIVRYEWDFGDGSQGEDKIDVSHVYQFSGTYLVTHRVTDDNGAQATTSRTVVVP